MGFYKGKKVFVTGHTGFKGSWLLAMLKTYGAVVKGYALEPECKEGLYNTINGNSLCTSVIDDIRNPIRLKEELSSFQPDFVFHLAAQSLVRKSFNIPSETFEVNVLGTSYLLEACSGIDNKCSIVIVTSDKVYENKESDNLYLETDELGGYDPYSASKACTELVVKSFRKSFFHPDNYFLHKKGLATARAGNVIGGGDLSKDRIIPDFIKALNKKEKLRIRNPESIRPWQHVLEPLTGYLKLGILLDSDPLQFSKAYNFGPHESDHLSVEELIKEMIAILGDGEYIISPDNIFHEAGILKLDINLAKKELNWFPVYNSKLAVKKTMDWYTSDFPEKITFQQIREYLALINEI